MLILTRRTGESIHIGDSITVTVCSIQGKQVRVGVTVPDDTVVLREEVYLRVKEENQKSTISDSQDLLAAATLWQN